MARTQATTGLSPMTFATGAEIVAEAAVAVAEQVHWSWGNRPHTHFALTTGDETWTTNGLGTLWITFPAPSSWVERLRIPIRIRADDVDTRVGARCVVAVAQTVEVRFTINGTSTTLEFANADNGTEKTSTLATGLTGTGHQTCIIELRTTSGAAGNMLRNVRAQAVAVTSSLPAPLDE